MSTGSRSTARQRSTPSRRDAPAQRGAPLRCRLVRRLAGLRALFAFVERFGRDQRLGALDRNAIAVVFEELFTNMVRHNARATGVIALDLLRQGPVVRGRIADPRSRRFDVTARPEVDVDQPLAAREPGGLGLHLVHHLVDELQYRYRDRRSTITFRRALVDSP